MTSYAPAHLALRAAITEKLNAHDLLGVLPHGAPEDEYDPEMEDLAALITAGEAITPEVVATVWHKWFSETAGEPEPPTSGMTAMATDLQTLQRGFTRGQLPPSASRFPGAPEASVQRRVQDAS